MQLINLVLASIAIVGASAGPIQRLVQVNLVILTLLTEEQKL